jgi:hypothetical protein
MKVEKEMGREGKREREREREGEREGKGVVLLMSFCPAG